MKTLSNHRTLSDARRALASLKATLESGDSAEYAHEIGHSGERWTILDRQIGNVEAELIDNLGSGDRYWIEFNRDDTFSLMFSN